MTNEERDLIQNFVARVGGAPVGNFSSVPAVQSGLPPIDREADAHIGELFTRYPEARYRITQLAFVQEHALAEAQNQMARMQADLQLARQQIQQLQQQSAPAPAASPWGAAAAPQPQPSRGFFGGLFGGGQQAAPPPQYAQPQYAQPQYGQPQYAQPQYAQQPQYAPGYQPGMFQQRGSGFLGSALTTAAGVAGGMVAGNALMNLFSGSHSGSGGFGGGNSSGASNSFTPEPTHYIPVSQPDNQAAPWASAPDQYEVGGLGKESTANSGGGWQQAASDSGWQDAPSESGGGGWDDASSNDDP
jgi:hypothetical protein